MGFFQKANIIAAIGLLLVANDLPAASASSAWVSVSGAGTSAEGCPRSNPCNSFQTACSAVSSENTSLPQVHVISPYYGNSGFNVLVPTIIDGAGTFAGVFISDGGSNGCSISMGSTEGIFILRNLTFEGNGSTGKGIFIEGGGDGAQLIIENCVIDGFTYGIYVDASASSSNITILNCTITNCTNTGLYAANSAAMDTLTISNISIVGGQYGIYLSGAWNNGVSITGSVISQCSINGIYADPDDSTNINCINSLFTSNGTAIDASNAAIVILSNNDFYDNDGVFAGGGDGIVQTANNNRVPNNTSVGPSPEGTVSII